MKIIKTTAGLILAVSLVFAVGCSKNGNQSTSNSKDSKTVTLGVQEGRKYTNSYFGLELNVPEGWYVASEEEKADLMQASQEVIAENNEDLAKKIDLSEEKVLYLLFASKYPLNHQGLNPNVMCMAENLGLLGKVSLKTGKDYLTASKTTIEQSGMPCAFGEISTEKLGGKDFDVMDITMDAGEIKISQKQYAAIFDGFALTFTITFFSEEDAKDIQTLLNTIKFE
ncbi:MAG: hypothetical protein ACOX4T_01790 [Acetivibrionales bacterium]|jgi:hypothetical protein